MSLLQRLLFQKAFNSQQLVHITVINLFQLHHLRDFSNETEQHSYSQDEQLCWTQLLALFSKYENLFILIFLDWFYVESISDLLSYVKTRWLCSHLCLAVLMTTGFVPPLFETLQSSIYFPCFWSTSICPLKVHSEGPGCSVGSDLSVGSTMFVGLLCSCLQCGVSCFSHFDGRQF